MEKEKLIDYSIEVSVIYTGHLWNAEDIQNIECVNMTYIPYENLAVIEKKYEISSFENFLQTVKSDSDLYFRKKAECAIVKMIERWMWIEKPWYYLGQKVMTASRESSCRIDLKDGFEEHLQLTGDSIEYFL